MSANNLANSISAHESDTTSIHGIADTAELATKTYADNAVEVLGNAIANSIATHEEDTTNIHGIANTANLVDLNTTQTLVNKTLAGSQYDRNIVNTNTMGPLELKGGNYGVEIKSAPDGSTFKTWSFESDGSLTAPTGVTYLDDLEIAGSLIFTGTATEINQTSITVTDSLIYLANSQFSSDLLDIGIYGAYGSPGDDANNHPHTGLFRDASDGKWKLISGGGEPENNIIDLSGVVYDTLKIGALEATSATIGNVSATELEYLSGSRSSLQDQIDNKSNNLVSYVNDSTASRTITSSTDNYNTVIMSYAGASTITVPSDTADSGFPIGSYVYILVTGSGGQTTVQAGSGATVVAADNQLKSRVRYSEIYVEKIAADTWIVSGDTSA